MSSSAAPKLPDDIASLKALLGERDRRIAYLQAKVEKLEAQQRLAQWKRFASSSERDAPQARLFDEPESEAATDDEAAEPDAAVQVAGHTKARPKRKALPKSLPRVRIEHALEHTECGCGGELEVIGSDTSEQLDVIPSVVYVIEHQRLKYRCRGCDSAPVSAAAPAQPIAKSVASPGLLAYVATHKYADGLPLYRQSAMFERLGVELPRQTLAGHMVKAGQLLNPLVNLLGDHLRDYDIVQMDETPVQVLDEPGKSAQSRSYMWVMKGGPPREPAVLYHYEPTRAGEVAERLLEGFEGYLQTDDYSGYNAVASNAHIRRIGCMSHARRRFHDALKALPKSKQRASGRLNKAMGYIRKLYAIERRIVDADPAERYRVRQHESVPVLDAFKEWLDRQSVPPHTLLGQAIRYALANWQRLRAYCEDGRLKIDNNEVENAIRPFAVGRKSWLFSATPAGAAASANLYTVIETAKANGLNEYAYLKYLFTYLPQAATVEEIEALLPWRADPAAVQAFLEHPDSTAQ